MAVEDEEAASLWGWWAVSAGRNCRRLLQYDACRWRSASQRTPCRGRQPRTHAPCTATVLVAGKSSSPRNNQHRLATRRSKANQWASLVLPQGCFAQGQDSSSRLLLFPSPQAAVQIFVVPSQRSCSKRDLGMPDFAAPHLAPRLGLPMRLTGTMTG